MEFSQLLDMILHVDKALPDMLAAYGAAVYVLLFIIVFAETGLVVFPFLPGDTLLFMGGALCADGSMNGWLLITLLIVAAVTGNTINYMIGKSIGNKAFTHNYRWLDRHALQRTHLFFETHGGKTIVLARWLPVVRTFAPFVAGISQMSIVKFQFFNISGAALWVAVLVAAGYYFGTIPFIKDHLNTIVLIGLAAAAVPVLVATIWRFFRKSHPIKI